MKDKICENCVYYDDRICFKRSRYTTVTEVSPTDYGCNEFRMKSALNDLSDWFHKLSAPAAFVVGILAICFLAVICLACGIVAICLFLASFVALFEMEAVFFLLLLLTPLAASVAAVCGFSVRHIVGEMEDIKW